MERKRNRARGSIAVLVDGYDHPIHRHLQMFGSGLDDAQIGLMRNQPVDR